MDQGAEVSLFENLIYEKKDGVVYLTISRPNVLNALDRATIGELDAAVKEARADPTVDGIILTGAGDKAFIGGADITELGRTTAFEAWDAARTGQAVMNLIEALDKPVIAAVNGLALGAGCEAAMACTIRLAVAEAQFGHPEVKLGLIPAGGGTQRMPRLVGKGRALQLILTGEMISAQEAYRIGLVDEIVPKDLLIPRAEAILRQIAANAPLAVKCALAAVNHGFDAPQTLGLALEAALFGLCAASEDKTEGIAALLAERAPSFRGR